MHRILLLAVATSLLISCASAKLTVVQPLEAPVDRVSLGINPLASGPMTEEQSSRLRSTFTTSLVDEGISVVAKEDAGASSLRGEIETYQPGNRTLRYLVGFGAGKGRFESNWVVHDPAGSEIGACRVDGSITIGGFGGSYDEVLEKAGERLAEFLLDRD